MTDEAQSPKRTPKRLWWVVGLVAALLAVLILPPTISVSRYKSQITRLMAASLGRPVRLSSVEVRLLPRPGFVLSDLTVDEDPAYGSEPILHASTVTASIRLFSLWRGRLEVDRVSLGEASFNLVRNDKGRWNLDSLFRSAAQQTGVTTSGATRARLPYIEASELRINVKNGVEKLPFSLTDADISFWQTGSGDWRLRLKGQPARTDTNLQASDTGTVRVEATIHPAPELRKIPIQLDMEWKEAQLGQLSRLLIGSDPGWRGDLRGNLHIDGTAETAHVQARLRAQGVHRAEFAPASPLDFDAQCSLQLHVTDPAVQNLQCESPLGDGHIRLTGERPATPDSARLSLELDRVSASAGLDVLRTLRSGFGEGLEAKGLITGKIAYQEQPAAPVEAKPAATHGKARGKIAPPSPLTGSIEVAGFELSGSSLGEPIRAAKLIFEPAPVVDGQPPALAATLSFPAGATAPLNVDARLAASGYQISMRGQASVARARELAHATLPSANDLSNLAGEPISLDLQAAGPWLAAESVPVSGAAPQATDALTGTITLKNANWKADFLANAVLLPSATLHLSPTETRWDPVEFTYGPVKGSATLTVPTPCAAPCKPQFTVQFAQLDASSLQAAILGAREKVTLISTLLAKLHPAAGPDWPRSEGTLKADTLVLGPVTLRAVSAALQIQDNGAHLTTLEANALGGHVHASGAFYTPASAKQTPSYMIEAQFEKLSPAAVGQLLNQHWSGAEFAASGKIELSGYTQQDLASTAKGTLHFDWKRGALSPAPVPELARFDRWSADATLGDGSITVQQNQLERGSAKTALTATTTLGSAPKLHFAASPANTASAASPAKK